MPCSHACPASHAGCWLLFSPPRIFAVQKSASTSTCVIHLRGIAPPTTEPRTNSPTGPQVLRPHALLHLPLNRLRHRHGLALLPSLCRQQARAHRGAGAVAGRGDPGGGVGAWCVYIFFGLGCLSFWGSGVWMGGCNVVFARSHTYIHPPFNSPTLQPKNPQQQPPSTPPARGNTTSSPSRPCPAPSTTSALPPPSPPRAPTRSAPKPPILSRCRRPSRPCPSASSRARRRARWRRSACARACLRRGTHFRWWGRGWRRARGRGMGSGWRSW